MSYNDLVSQMGNLQMRSAAEQKRTKEARIRMLLEMLVRNPVYSCGELTIATSVNKKTSRALQDSEDVLMAYDLPFVEKLVVLVAQSPENLILLCHFVEAIKVNVAATRNILQVGINQQNKEKKNRASAREKTRFIEVFIFCYCILI